MAVPIPMPMTAKRSPIKALSIYGDTRRHDWRPVCHLLQLFLSLSKVDDSTDIATPLASSAENCQYIQLIRGRLSRQSRRFSHRFMLIFVRHDRATSSAAGRETKDRDTARAA